MNNFGTKHTFFLFEELLNAVFNDKVTIDPIFWKPSSADGAPRASKTAKGPSNAPKQSSKESGVNFCTASGQSKDIDRQDIEYM